MSEAVDDKGGSGEAWAPLHIFDDSPASEAADLFGHSAYADVLVDVLSGDRRTLTVGLLGPWGIGKSTVLRQMATRLRGQGSAVVLFDAWRYDGPSLRRQMLREVGLTVRAQKAIDERRFAVDMRLRRLDVDTQETRFRVRLSWGAVGVALVQALVVLIMVGCASQIQAVQETIDRLELKNGTVLTLALGVTVFVAGLVGASFRPIPETTTTKRLEDPEAFQEAFSELIQAVTAPSLVIAIDNLDRSPARDALELLSTIKTFLEPAVASAAKGTAVRVYFVVAVDEEGLRRHLTSAGDVSEDAAEFLRKIFSATIRFAPLLPDDLREYVGVQLKAAEASLQLSADQARQLGLLVAAAFNRSPRQVVQFLNTLQLRLRLLRHREMGAHAEIASNLSASPLAIAKLMLIEDRWPEHYDRLRRQPHLLNEWHATARNGRGKAQASPEWHTLEPFLRLSEFVEIGDVRPYVSMKQSEAERTLPEYAAFRRGMTSADRDIARQIIARNGSFAEDYVACATALFRSELSAGNVEAARAVIDVVFAVPTLAGHASRPGVSLLEEGVRDPDFRGQLRYLPGRPLLQAAVESTVWVRRHVVAHVGGRLQADSDSQVQDAVRAIASVSSSPDSDVLDQLRGFVSLMPPSARLSELAELAESRGDLLTPGLINGVVEHLTQHPGELVDGVRGSAARGLTGVLMLSAANEIHGHRLVTIATEALERSIRDGANESADSILKLLERAPLHLLRRNGDRLLAELTESVSRVDPELRERVLELAWQLAAEPERAGAVGRLVDADISSNPDSVRAVDRRLGGLDEGALGHAITSIAEIAAGSGPTETGVALAEVVAVRSLPDLEAICATWVELGLGEAEFEELKRLLRALERLDNKPRLQRAITNQVRQVRDDASLSRWITAAALAGVHSPEVTAVAEKVLPGWLERPHSATPISASLASAIEVAVKLRVPDSGFDRMLEPLLRWVMGSDEFAPVIDLLIPIQAKLSRDTRTSLRHGLVARVRTDGDSDWISRFERLLLIASDSEKEHLARLVVENLHASAPPHIARWLFTTTAALIAETDLFRLYLEEVRTVGPEYMLEVVRESVAVAPEGPVARASQAGPNRSVIAMMRRLELGPMSVTTFEAEFNASPASSSDFQQLLIGAYAAWNADWCELTPRGSAVVAAAKGG